MKKIIIGLVGETGSGKDTVAEYLKENYGATLMRFADPIKETLSIYFDKLSKEDQQWLYLVFKERFGEDILCRAMKKRIEEEKNHLIVVNGLRMPCDYDFIREFSGAKILYVTIDQKLRWKRVLNRNEKSDDNISFEKFQELDQKPTEIHIKEIGEKADKTIYNEKGLDYLFSQVDDFMQELGIEKIKK